MPALILLIGTAVKVLALYTVTRILLALGLAYVTYSGFDALHSQFESQIQTAYGGLIGDVWNIATLAGADVAISIIFSAIAVRLALSGIVNGVVSTLAFKAVTPNN